MSISSALSSRLNSYPEDASTRLKKVFFALFGDRIGASVFLAVVLFGLMFVRQGFFINDNWTIANTLVGVADGHLWIDEVRYGVADSPGVFLVDGDLYGRNFGHVFFALPFLWALEGVSQVADPRVAFAALWSLLLLGLVLLQGTIFNYETEFSVVGSGLALLIFAGNLAVATPLDPKWFPLIALELSTVVASAFVAVLLYRLLARIHSRRVGVFAGLTTILATGFGFWSSIPKRHAVVTCLLFATIYCLYRSREAGDTRKMRQFRALAYVWVGLVTWVNAMEGLVIFITLLAVDIPTAPSNDLRTAIITVIAFSVSLVPFFLTNYLVIGSPIEPPHLWPAYDGGTVSSGQSGRSNSNSGGGASSKLLILTNLFGRGITVMFEQPLRLVGTFLRSGSVAQPFIDKGNAEVELAMVETAPILGVFVAFPALLFVKVKNGFTIPDRKSPVFAVDVFVFIFAILFFLVYIPKLPLHAQIGARYLIPLYALGLYGIARLSIIREVFEKQSRMVYWTTASGVLIGGQSLLIYLIISDTTGTDLLQTHAWIGLGVATLVGGWALLSVTKRRSSRLGAVCIGLAVAAGTTFILLTNLSHLASVGDFVIPIARWLALRFLIA
ncbi:glycosyltransferase family 39 protein [Halomarina rubra]|uniref:Glycosyltransferase family 39 protein n=1 Tax=Halomarina rubra TaxID=2071873 RepID=A0ABD6ASA9_9EURY|nr:glycosyltransferase family 39 protein [Halomarina rubra]